MYLRPPPHGTHPVGATTFVSSVTPPLQISAAKLKASSELAFQLDGVSFTAFYPADISRKPAKGLHWLIRPLSSVFRGYARFVGVSAWLLWPVFYLFGVFLKIPVYPNASLLNPKGKVADGRWPLIIFSHGLGGSRMAYSQLCSRLAASGKVVLAAEHRDGTAPVTLRSGGHLLYFKEDDVVWDPEHSPSEPSNFRIRTEQLAFRQHEIYLIYSAFCALVQKGVKLDEVDGADIDLTSWSSNAPVICDDVTLAGHSFGGCTLLSLLSSNPPSSDYASIPVKKAVLYDPWLEPLPTPGPTPATPSKPSLDGDTLATVVGKEPLEKLLVINSAAFTLWKDHFTRLQGVLDAWDVQEKSLFTLGGSQHVSFSDFPVLPVIRTKSAAKLMDITADLSLAFLDGTLTETLEQLPTKSMEAKIIGKRKDGRPKRTIVGDVGDIVVH
ncbi:platelet-activating factor acetylhydrolase, isoform II-domain-containing protein [Mycena rebaudengoi]|nr:platelet-activating factor acetylhydrolase, isoform II-domain-containing protein [Mycena rebaudengoi]